MHETACGLKSVLDYLLEKRDLDFTGYHSAMLERRIGNRLAATRCASYVEYLAYLACHVDEMDRLIDGITINVSRFFRDTLTFELLADRILPAIVQERVQQRGHSLRIWSAGCAMGEEPYSVAILVHELFEKEGIELNLHLFATDIDASALKGAGMAVYPLSSIKNIKYRLLTKYFVPEAQSFRLDPDIRNMVTFSNYDMLDKKHRVPPDSIFGSFDLVLCRNLLIYFNTEYQETICTKLYQSLAETGYLILGDAETPTRAFQNRFVRIYDFSPIYRKRRGITP